MQPRVLAIVRHRSALRPHRHQATSMLQVPSDCCCGLVESRKAWWHMLGSHGSVQVPRRHSGWQPPTVRISKLPLALRPVGPGLYAADLMGQLWTPQRPLPAASAAPRQGNPPHSASRAHDSAHSMRHLAARRCNNACCLPKAIIPTDDGATNTQHARSWTRSAQVLGGSVHGLSNKLISHSTARTCHIAHIILPR